MVIYKKENTTHQGRGPQSGSSPRDRQMRVQAENMRNDGSSALIATLTEQVVQLRTELDKRPSQGYTDDEFNKEVIKAVEDAISKEREANARYILELENKLKEKGGTQETLDELNKLKLEVSTLKSVITGKDETIEVLKSRPINVEFTPDIRMGDKLDESYPHIKSDRPQMEEQYIDPSATDSDFKSNINIDSVKEEQKEGMSSKVNKLKDLLGGGIGK